MKTYELIAPCHFGLEAVLKREIDDLGYDISKTEDGRVTFIGDMEALCRANVFLRSAERILLKAGSFTARTFDELFECTKALPWDSKGWQGMGNKGIHRKEQALFIIRHSVHYEKSNRRALKECVSYRGDSGDRCILSSTSICHEGRVYCRH